MGVDGGRLPSRVGKDGAIRHRTNSVMGHHERQRGRLHTGAETENPQSNPGIRRRRGKGLGVRGQSWQISMTGSPQAFLATLKPATAKATPLWPCARAVPKKGLHPATAANCVPFVLAWDVF